MAVEEHVAEAMATEPTPAPPASVPASPEQTSAGTVPTPADADENALPPPGEKHWYVVKVQSGREDTIREAVLRRVKKENLDAYVSQIIVPVERTTEIVKGKKITRKRKLYPGYLFVEVDFNDRILYLFRETPGVGDFVGAGLNKKPLPMSPADVQKVLQQKDEVVQKQAAPKIKLERGERVKVKDGMFAGMEGEVNDILEAKGLVRVMLKFFGRDVPVELEYWQIEHV